MHVTVYVGYSAEWNGDFLPPPPPIGDWAHPGGPTILGDVIGSDWEHALLNCSVCLIRHQVHCGVCCNNGM